MARCNTAAGCPLGASLRSGTYRVCHCITTAGYTLGASLWLGAHWVRQCTLGASLWPVAPRVHHCISTASCSLGASLWLGASWVHLCGRVHPGCITASQQQVAPWAHHRCWVTPETSCAASMGLHGCHAGFPQNALATSDTTGCVSEPVNARHWLSARWVRRARRPLVTPYVVTSRHLVCGPCSLLV